MSSRWRTTVLAATIALALAAATVVAVSGRGSEPQKRRSVPSTALSTSTAPSTSTTAGQARPPASPSSGNCPSGGPQAHGEIALGLGDIDGDGRPDDVYLYDSPAGPVVGVRTASGRSSEMPAPANIVTEIAGSADVNGDGAEEVWVVASGNTLSGQQVQLGMWWQCELVPVRNVQGEPYEFQVNPATEGSREGGGVGCVDVDGDGRLDLVGLTFTVADDQYQWRRTEVRVHGREARNGRTETGTFVKGRDDVSIELLSDITCGSRKLGGNRALALPPEPPEASESTTTTSPAVPPECLEAWRTGEFAPLHCEEYGEEFHEFRRKQDGG